MKSPVDCKCPFSVRLIEELRSKAFISSGIMLPLLVGAYKIRDNYVAPINIAYLKEVFTNMLSELSEANMCLYFKECEASHNFVLEIAERPLRSYKLHIYYNGKPVIYCKDSEDEKTITDLNESVNYLIDKYVSVLGKYCNYIDSLGLPNYSHMKELGNCVAENLISEYDVIMSVLQ